MQETILIVYLVVSIALIGIILLQQGKGAEMGASFGAGGANTVFGAAGSGNVLTKTTTVLAIIFFATALSISYFNSEVEVKTDAVLDETISGAKSVVEQKVAPSLEAELPTSQDGLESEVAPAQKTEAVDAETKKAVIEATQTKDSDEDAPKNETSDQ